MKRKGFWATLRRESAWCWVLAGTLFVAVLLPAFVRYFIVPRFDEVVVGHARKMATGTVAQVLYTLPRDWGAEISADSVDAPFRRALSRFSRREKLCGVSMIAPDGTVVYSTVPERIGQRVAGRYFGEKIVPGGIFARFVEQRVRLMTKSVGGKVESYIPMMSGPRFLGAVAVCHDMTPERGALLGVLNQVMLLTLALSIAIVTVALTTVVKAVRSIQVRDLAEASLRESEERIRRITDTTLDGVVGVDEGGRINFWNPASERLFGYRAEEVIGRDVHEVLAPKRFHEAYRQGFRPFRESGRGESVGRVIELAALRRTGEEFPIELSLAPVRHDGGWQAVAVVRDISARKQEEERERFASFQAGVTEMSVSILHNIGNAIMGVLNRAGRIEVRGNDLAEMARLFSRVEATAKRRIDGGEPAERVLTELMPLLGEVGENLRELAEDTFGTDASRIREGAERIAEIIKLHQDSSHYTPKVSDFNIDVLFRDAVLILSESLAKRGIEVETEVVGERREVSLPRNQLLLAMVDLVRNAVEAIDARGGGESAPGRIRVTASSPAEDRLEIRVSDNGCGIPRERLAEIFQSGSSTKPRRAGMGLHSVANFVQSIGGGIEARSDGPNLGAELVIRLPRSLGKERADGAAGEERRWTS